MSDLGMGAVPGEIDRAAYGEPPSLTAIIGRAKKFAAATIRGNEEEEEAL
ncbi:hypothetical protein [uncultured Sphingomonas sp.]|nr:hypothetical protein [uncultured Sphingomonas sp.]